MKTERPILFSGAMVRAVLEGRKTQTRRVVKPQPDAEFTVAMLDDWERDSCSSGIDSLKFSTPFEVSGRWQWWPLGYKKIRCPYGQRGDRLWVRENWSHTGEAVWTVGDARGRGRGGVIYQATDAEPVPGCWWPSIHLPREFSRIDLEITGVRVERLQDISADDCACEGLQSTPFMPALKHGVIDGYLHAEDQEAVKRGFQALWDSINGKPQPNKPDVSWVANPWVWVVEFKRVEGRAA